MVTFNRAEGRLLLGQPADEDERYDDDAEDLYARAVFETDSFAITFYSGIGGYYSVEDSHIQPVDGQPVYFPHENEAVAEVNTGILNDEELVERADDVCIEYAVVDGDVYVRSQSEITAYGGTYLVVDGELYQIVDSLLTHPSGETRPDEFLGIESTEEPVTVENVATGYRQPVPYERVVELVESDESNGALELEEASLPVAELVEGV